jgi:hypothetical protein
MNVRAFARQDIRPYEMSVLIATTRSIEVGQEARAAP